MSENRLPIIETENRSFSNNKILPTSRRMRERELQAKFERLWLIDPERFNPLRNCLEKERLERTWQLLTTYVDLSHKLAADIGCGAGIFSRRLRDGGARVDAIDIAENALKQFEDRQNITLRCETMPDTCLPDEHYDVIVCTELIAELPKEDHRLFFAELSRLIKANGVVICSTPIDIDTDGAVELLIDLAQTEFDILADTLSYHALYLRLKRFFAAPALFIQGWKDHDVKQRELTSRRGFNKWWYGFNASPPLSWLWYVIEPITRPLLRYLNTSPRLMLFLEKVCRFLSDQKGLSHYLFLAKRRPLPSIDANDIPIERPRRKQVWE